MADCGARERPPGHQSAQMGSHRTQGGYGVGRRRPGPFGSDQASSGPAIGLRDDLRWPRRVGAGANQGPVTKPALVRTPCDLPGDRLGLWSGWDVAQGTRRARALRLGPVEAAVHLPRPLRAKGGYRGCRNPRALEITNPGRRTRRWCSAVQEGRDPGLKWLAMNTRASAFRISRWLVARCFIGG